MHTWPALTVTLRCVTEAFLKCSMQVPHGGSGAVINEGHSYFN